MGIIDIFGKKTSPPIEKEPQIKRSPLRGPGGKFISKKQKVRKPIAAAITATFYGREIRKVYDGKKWYFAAEDILALANPLSGKEKVRRKKTFENVKKSVSKTINNTLYSDTDGCIKLIREVEGEFPGPLPDWLKESSAFPYEAPPKVKEAAPSGETPTSNPSDRGM